MFQIKDFGSIVAGTLNYASAVQSRVTDFNVGSVFRTLIESVALMVDELYQRMVYGLLDATLASTYRSFLFDQIPAAGSTGTVRFSRPTNATADIAIPAGTRVTTATSTLTWAVTQNGAITSGTKYVDLPVLCETTGVATNVAAGVITQLVDNITGVVTVTNPAPFTTGRDVESEQSRLTRFHAYIRALARGVLGAVEYGAALAQVTSGGIIQESVTEVKAYEPYTIDPDSYPVGYVEVYIHSGGTTAASGALVTQAQQIVNGYYADDGTPVIGWKAAGVVAQVMAAPMQAVNVTGTLTVSSGYVAADVRAAVITAISTYLVGLRIGQEAVVEKIDQAAMAVPGVYNWIMSTPTGSVIAAISRGHKMAPGTITVALA